MPDITQEDLRIYQKKQEIVQLSYQDLFLDGFIILLKVSQEDMMLTIRVAEELISALTLATYNY